MTCAEIMAELEKMGSPSIKKIYENHGAPKAIFGVKISDMKTIVKKVKKDHALSLELFRTRNSDAQYLAGLIADEKKITKKDLQEWINLAGWYMVTEFPIAWVAAESAHGWELALEWIESDKEKVQVAGWSTLASIASIKKDEELDLHKLKSLLKRVEKEIHKAPNRTRYAMNNFVLAMGCFIPALTDAAMQTGKSIGVVTVNMGNTSCKVPDAPQYIQKAVAMGKVGKKKKMARC